jgi:hypothetical protein
LDESANVRFGLEFGLTNRFTAGIGRSRFELYDGFLQYKILRQQTGKRKIPLSISLFAGLEVNTAKTLIEVEDYNKYRLAYSSQLLIASKLSNRLSIQIMPTFVHKNLVKTKLDKNDIYACGIGGRFKITNRVGISAEYYYVLPNQLGYELYNPLSVGVDLETGGHVFQLHITNSIGMTEKNFISATNYSWSENQFLFGFNICRNFSFNK